jgi:hypothetical protein
MRFASQFAITATLAALVSSKAIKLEKRAPALDVKLSAQGNTLVKAVITNTGSDAINLLNKGTFLDNAAVEKVTVSSDGQFYFFTALLFAASYQLSLSINKGVACAQARLMITLHAYTIAYVECYAPNLPITVKIRQHFTCSRHYWRLRMSLLILCSWECSFPWNAETRQDHRPRSRRIHKN